MTPEERLAKVFPDIELENFDGLRLLDCMLGPAELYDAAIIGIGERCGQGAILVYDGHKLAEIDDNLPGGEDHDTYGSVTGAWMGDRTPIVVMTKAES